MEYKINDLVTFSGEGEHGIGRIYDFAEDGDPFIISNDIRHPHDGRPYIDNPNDMLGYFFKPTMLGLSERAVETLLREGDKVSFEYRGDTHVGTVHDMTDSLIFVTGDVFDNTGHYGEGTLYRNNKDVIGWFFKPHELTFVRERTYCEDTKEPTLKDKLEPNVKLVLRDGTEVMFTGNGTDILPTSLIDDDLCNTGNIGADWDIMAIHKPTLNGWELVWERETYEEVRLKKYAYGWSNYSEDNWYRVDSIRETHLDVVIIGDEFFNEHTTYIFPLDQIIERRTVDK